MVTIYHTRTTHSIAVTTEGKKCLIDSEAKEKLCPLLYDDNSEVKLNAIKVLFVALQ